MTENEMKALFSERLQMLLKKYDMKQNDLSVILGVSESAVGKWILQKAMPRMGIIQKLSDHFNVGKSYFLEYDVSQPIPKKDPVDDSGSQPSDAQSMPLFNRERNLIKKYRVLPELAKDEVDDYVDFKYDRYKLKDD